jgi:hypothetical protein
MRGLFRRGPVRALTGVMIAAALAALPLYIGSAHARDPDGRYANSPLHDWFQSLQSSKGPAVPMPTDEC